MKKYSNEELIKCLQYEDYPQNKALQESVISQLNDLSDEAQAMFDKWYEDRKMPKFEVHGISSDFLLEKHKMNAISLVLAFDGLIKDPDKAAWLLRKPVIRYS